VLRHNRGMSTTPDAQAGLPPEPVVTQRGLALGYADVLSDDGTRLRAWTNDPRGEIDGPTVLLCNGLGVSQWAWPAFLDPACGVRVVSWNHRGVAGSDRPTDPQRVGVDSLVEDALSVLDHFGLDRVPVVAWSIGVNTAFELAAAHPERVSGIFAVAGVPGDTFRTMLAPLRVPPAVARPVTLTLARALRQAGRFTGPLLRRLPVGERALTLLTHSGLMLPVADRRLALMAVHEFLNTPLDWYFHLAVRTSEHPRVSLSSLDLPVLMVGATYDVLTGARDLRTAAERLPHGEYVELRGSHFVQLEQPEVVHGLLGHFLSRLT
jgi:pimeloyl-ACP methyl ester carboxylesterase